MSIQEYFDNIKGTGVLATANEDGVVDVAVYARPHVLDEETISFIMRDRLSHTNLQSNPHAAYLFHEAGSGYKGKRLYLTKTGEETDPEKIAAVRRRQTPAGCGAEEGESQFLVTFRIDGTRPLIGDSD
jgi:hypothetical protein